MHATVPERVERATEIRVGERYLVPGVVIALWPGAPTAWYPVLGPAHSDAEYIKASRHFHFDARFLPEALFPLTALVKGRTVLVADSPRAMMVKIHVVRGLPGDKGGAPEIEHREAVCVREMPDFPSELAPWFAALADGYASETVRPGTRCPHQGVCLAGLPAAPDGAVTCPGHGLRWNLATGRARPAPIKGREASPRLVMSPSPTTVVMPMTYVEMPNA